MVSGQRCFGLTEQQQGLSRSTAGALGTGRERLSEERGGGAGVGDLGELYLALARSLERIVRHDVRAPEGVIEEACQFAWSSLAYHRHRVRRDAALSWLAKTAVHEACKLIRRGARELSLDATLEEGESAIRLRTSAPQELVEQRDRLAGIRGLSERQQRLVWLQALGLSYAEMAAHEGYTSRTVERQLFRARSALRSAGL
ncbi:MAG: sigma-70 family RNA polymerase sigma factor [Actinomycetota bacterium]|nr:sigma-70 family RNA polymerase sigma factor [Actinomycetota bacterium]